VPHFGEGRPLLFRWARHRGVVTLRLLRLLLLLMMMMIAMMIRGRSGDNRPLIERRQALSSAAALPGNRYATAAVECRTFAPPHRTSAPGNHHHAHSVLIPDPNPSLTLNPNPNNKPTLAPNTNPNP